MSQTKKIWLCQFVVVGILVGSVASSPYLTAFRSHLPAQCDVRVSTHIGHPIHPPNVHCDIAFTEWFHGTDGKCTKQTYHACISAGGFHTQVECQDVCPESHSHWYN